MSVFCSEKLPPSFVNEIQTSSNPIILRSNVRNLEDCNKWVKEFGEITNTKWNSRTSKPCGERFVCSKLFVCHHSAFMKVSKEANKRSFSKNSNCRAKINIKVKLETSVTRKRDSFIQRGLVAVITINDVHNHSLHTAEALKFLPTNVSKEKFIEYFNNGMGVAEACRYHESILQVKNEFIEGYMANRRTTPPRRTVQYWYDQWRLQKSKPMVSETPAAPKVKEEVSTEEILINYEEDGKSSYEEKREVLLKEIFSQISKNDEIHKSTLSGLSKFLRSLKDVKSFSSWEIFLHTAGSSIPPKRSSGAAIRVQPTSIARSSAQINRSSKRLPVRRPASVPPNKKRKYS